MHEGQIEKGPHRCVGFPIEAASKGSVRDGARQRVGRERVGAAAEHVAGKLVEQNHQRKRAFRGFFESREIAPCRRLMNRKKPRPDRQVEFVILLEPFFRPRFPPEGNNVGDCRISHMRFSLRALTRPSAPCGKTTGAGLTAWRWS